MIRKAEVKDLSQIMEIVDAIRLEVMENDMLKWDENYPTKAMFEKDIKGGDLYVVGEAEQDQIVGFACINDQEHEEFKDIPWAKEKGLVVHRLGIKMEHRQRGYGLSLVEYAEALGKDKGYDELKCCIYERNYKSENLFKKKGFTYAGDIKFPEYAGDFYCYEKQI